MVLDPPPIGWTDVDLNALILRIQNYASSQGYAVLKSIIKRFKDDIVRKAWIRCDRGGNPEKNSKSTGKRITSSRLIDYSFKLIAQRTRIAGVQTDWTLDVINSNYNYGYILSGSHSSLRNIAITQEIKDSIIN